MSVDLNNTLLYKSSEIDDLCEWYNYSGTTKGEPDGDCDRIAKEVALKIHEEKTKIITHTRRIITANYHFEKVQICMYLGTTFTHGNNEMDGINRRTIINNK